MPIQNSQQATQGQQALERIQARLRQAGQTTGMQSFTMAGTPGQGKAVDAFAIQEAQKSLANISPYLQRQQPQEQPQTSFVEQQKEGIPDAVLQADAAATKEAERKKAVQSRPFYQKLVDAAIPGAQYREEVESDRKGFGVALGKSLGQLASNLDPQQKRIAKEIEASDKRNDQRLAELKKKADAGKYDKDKYRQVLEASKNYYADRAAQAEQTLKELPTNREVLADAANIALTVGTLGTVAPGGLARGATGQLVKSAAPTVTRTLGQGVVQGLKTGAALGAATGATEAIRDADSFGKAFEDIYKGALMGAVTGAAFPAIGAVAKAAAKKGVDVGSKVAKFATSQTTGLKPETITEVLSNPSNFSKQAMEEVDRLSLANKVKGALDERLSELAYTGKNYEFVRRGGKAVNVPPGTFEDVLQDFGITLKNGAIELTEESVPLSQGDIAAIEGFLGQYGKQKLSGNAFLNARQALSQMAKYDATKTTNSQNVSRALRQRLDALGKDQIKGLANIDALYSGEKKILKELQKDLVDRDGNLKDSALGTLANILGRGKDIRRARLLKLYPELEKEVRILKAIEDIEDTAGNKVGTYLRGGITGGLAGGAPGVVMGLIASSPTVAVNALKAASKAYNIPKGAYEKIVIKINKNIPLSVKEKAFMKMAIDGLTDYARRNEQAPTVEENIINVQ